MNRPYVPDDYDTPDDFGPDDDPNHETQDGRWIGVLFMGVLLGVLLTVFAIAKLAGVI